MKKFRLINDGEPREITRENIRAYIKGQKPYHVVTDTEAFYALCPRCTNSIQLVGVYSNKVRPYGKHTGKDVSGFPPYDPYEYRKCPYASGQAAYNPDNSVPEDMTPLDMEIYNLARENFDRILYFITKKFGFKLFREQEKEWARIYHVCKGYMRHFATRDNLPLMVCAVCNNPTFDKMLVAEESCLYRMLEEAGAVFEKARKQGFCFVRSVQGNLARDVCLYFGDVTRHADEYEYRETVTLELSTNYAPDFPEYCMFKKKKVTLREGDFEYFHALLRKKDWDRDNAVMDYVLKLMPPLPDGEGNL